MVIRRIREHVGSHNWFAVGIDLAIVVVGVFLGIQASNWNEARIEAEQGRSYRARLIDELDFNTRQHRQQAAYYRQVLAHGVAAMEALGPSRAANPTQYLIDSFQATQTDTSPGKSYIYNEMVSAGLVDRLGNEQVQQAASDYYLQLSANNAKLLENHPYRDIVRGVVPYGVQGAIVSQCGDRFVRDGARIIGVALVENCVIELDPPSAAAAAARLRAEPGIERDLVRYLAVTHERLESLDATLTLATKLKAALESTNANSH